MPMELLQSGARRRDDLPMELFLTPEMQDKLRILDDAGHIICSFPAAKRAHQEPVRVHMVTPLGRDRCHQQSSYMRICMQTAISPLGRASGACEAFAYLSAPSDSAASAPSLCLPLFRHAVVP